MNHQKIEKIQILISLDKIDDAIFELKNVISKKSENYNHILLQASKYRRTRTDNLDGIINRDAYNLELSKVRKSLLEITSIVKEEELITIEKSSSKSENTKICTMCGRKPAPPDKKGWFSSDDIVRMFAYVCKAPHCDWNGIVFCGDCIINMYEANGEKIRTFFKPVKENNLHQIAKCYKCRKGILHWIGFWEK